MKKACLLNSEISYEISKLGHTQHLTICDAGLPIPNSVKRIDLALTKGVPNFLETLDVILSEMQVEEIILAQEITTFNPQILEAIKTKFLQYSPNKPIAINFISHESFKTMTHSSQAIIRTGECSPYANIILKSGVTF